MSCDTGEHVGEPGLRIDVVELGRLMSAQPLTAAEKRTSHEVAEIHRSGHVQGKRDERAHFAIDTFALLELGRHRERLGRVDDEHYERCQFCRPTVENFHCRPGRMSVH